MMSASYLIAVTTSQNSTDNALAVWNIAGKGQVICGFSNGVVSTTLWIVPKGKLNREEVVQQLQARPGIQRVAVVALSNPVSEKELVGIRQFFADLNLDASGVKDDALLNFVNSNINGQYTHYMEFVHRPAASNGIQINPIEQHPKSSTAWPKQAVYTHDEQPHEELPVADLTIRNIVIEEEVEAPEPPGPLPGRSR